MLDVLLYTHDQRGCLTLREEAFDTFDDLCLFFASMESRPWEWAEVTGLGVDGRIRTSRYSATFLRWRVPGPILLLSLN
jgi:hypothetical protein